MEYLRADRAVFVNPECCIQLYEHPNPDISGPHWYCDAVAVDLRNKHVFLCEVTFAKGTAGLLKRLQEWAANWDGVRKALVRDCNVDPDWPVRPWLFVPDEEKDLCSLIAKVKEIKGTNGAPAFVPRITTLESILPWKNIRSWSHQDVKTPRPKCVPVEMCS